MMEHWPENSTFLASRAPQTDFDRPAEIRLVRRRPPRFAKVRICQPLQRLIQ